MDRHPAVAAATVIAIVLTACANDPTGSRSTPTNPSPEAVATTTGPASASSTPPAASAPAPPPTSTEATTTAPAPPPLDDASAGWEVVGEGFDGPLQVLADPRDARTLVVEQVGRVTPLEGGAPVLDLTDRVTAGGERGLLGVAFHAEGDRLFVHYSGQGGQTVLSSFPVGDEGLDPATETVLLTVVQPAANHNGGALLFAPDGALVLGLGDGGGGGDQFGNGQDPGTLLGTLLRFDVDAAPGELRPAEGNPFLDGGGDPAVWAYGLRNPWRVAFDDGHLYVADVGQDAVEEVSVVSRDDVAGANFGWPVLEGSQCFQQADCDPEGTVLPSAELFHEQGACSIIGGIVVPRGHPSGLGGAFLYSDLCDTRLRALTSDGQTAVVEGAQLPASPLGFGEGPDGQVWVGTTEGQVLELTAR